ncbi:hypothetical protein BGX27_002182 [Mortierella sp. AM989]|nr:hypothetical protein BGX27_002182 [Mortierella sp. AM989]
MSTILWTFILVCLYHGMKILRYLIPCHAKPDKSTFFPLVPNDTSPSEKQKKTLLASIILAYTDHYDALISGGLFEGVNTADPKANRTSIFQDPKNHADAVASILIHSAKETSFSPSQEIHTPPEIYFNFLQHVISFPAFRYRGNVEDAHHALYLDGDLEQLLDQISDHYYKQDDDHHLDLVCNNNNSNNNNIDDGMKEKKQRIREAFRKLIPKTVENKDWKQWLLSLVTIQKLENSDHVTFDLAQVRLTISTGNEKNNEGKRKRKEGKDFDCSKGGCTAVIDRQVALLIKSSYFVVGGYVSFFSSEISKMVEKGTVDEFLELLTTKQKNSSVEDTLELGQVYHQNLGETGPQQHSFHVSP